MGLANEPFELLIAAAVDHGADVQRPVGRSQDEDLAPHHLKDGVLLAAIQQSELLVGLRLAQARDKDLGEDLEVQRLGVGRRGWRRLRWRSLSPASAVESHLLVARTALLLNRSSVHSHGQASLEAAGGTPVPPRLVHHTVPDQSDAGVAAPAPHAPLEKAGAPIAAGHAVVLPGALIAAHCAGTEVRHGHRLALLANEPKSRRGLNQLIPDIGGFICHLDVLHPQMICKPVTQSKNMFPN